SNICPFKHATTNDSDARVLAMNVGNMSISKHSVPVSGSQPKEFGNGTKPRKQDKFKGTIDSKRADLPRDPNAWCDYHHRKGHSTQQCQAKLRDPDYIKYLESQNSTAPPQPHAKAVRVHKVSKSHTNIWIYDTACTDCMTDQAQYLHDFSKFEIP